MTKSLEASTTSVPSNFGNASPIQINIDFTTGIIAVIVFIFGLGAAWGSLKHAVSAISKLLEKMEPEVKDMGTKVAVLWADKYAPAHSPRKLNDRGTAVLNGSGIKTIVDDKRQELLDLVKAKGAKNPYDAEMEIHNVMADLPNRHPELIDTLKTGAYKTGVDLNTVLFAGSIYLRDSIFGELGFNLDDLDKPLPNGK